MNSNQSSMSSWILVTLVMLALGIFSIPIFTNLCFEGKISGSGAVGIAFDSIIVFTWILGEIANQLDKCTNTPNMINENSTSLTSPKA